jgi:hypothetical protein
MPECVRPIPPGGQLVGNNFNKFRFTRTRILFTEYQIEHTYFLDLFGVCAFVNEANYTFNKVFDNKDRKRWEITIAGGNHCKSYLKINLWNRMLCNIVHKRYWVQQEANYIKKGMVTGLFTILGTIAGVS